MKTHNEKIQYLSESVEALRDLSYKKRKILLTLLYWKVFDGIDIPDTLMKDILNKGTNPETIARTLRKTGNQSKKNIEEE